MKEGTREWIRSRTELIAVASVVVGVVVAALVATLLFPNAGKTVVTVGVAVSALAVAAFYAWARFPMAPRESSASGIPTLTIGGQLKRTQALFQRIMLLVVVAWCTGVTLMSPNLTSAKRNALAIVGSLVLSVAGWLLVRNHLRCPRCGSDFKKERSAKLGRRSMDSRGAAELWDACPHCGVSFNEPYR